MSKSNLIDSTIRIRVVQKITRILNLNHSHPTKREVKDHQDRLNFACPYCGDSTKNNRKKRGNLYWNDLYYHCYNCDEHRPLNFFLQDFNEKLDTKDNINVINYINENKKDYSLGVSLDFHLFEKIEKLALSFEDIALGYNIYPINENTYRAYPYLRSRMLHKKLNRFGYDPRRKELYIFNLTKDKKIIGFQVRKLTNSYGPKYRTYDIERIYEKLNIKLDVTEDEIYSLNKISILFGILQTDLNRKFTVFEGPIDSMFIPNSIGLGGVKKDITDFTDIPHTRYFFDNDSKGKNKMIEKIKKGNYVFLWERFLDKYNIKPNKVKDLNDLIKYEYKYKIGCLKNLDDFFSNDELDIVWL